jgi:hypothetical protein
MSLLGEHNWYLPRWLHRLLPQPGQAPETIRVPTRPLREPA